LLWRYGDSALNSNEHNGEKYSCAVTMMPGLSPLLLPMIDRIEAATGKTPSVLASLEK